MSRGSLRGTVYGLLSVVGILQAFTGLFRFITGKEKFRWW